MNNKKVSLKKGLVTFLLASAVVAVPVISGITVSNNAYAEENIQQFELSNTNQFYSGFKTSSHNYREYTAYSTNSSGTLLGSTTYGEWDNSFEDYNCYAYALGRKDWCLIGQFSNHKLDIDEDFWGYPKSLNNTIEELADYTKQDLHSLGYECVNLMQNWFHEPYTSQTLICVRKSKNDFHFMRYDNGDWLHKPGNTWLLKYNGVPNKDVDWYSEGTYIDDGVQYYTSSQNNYTGDIYFIAYANSHNYNSCHYDSKTQHAIMCNNCSAVLRYEAHKFVSFKNNAKRCIGCGYTIYDGGIGQIILKEDEDKI